MSKKRKFSIAVHLSAEMSPGTSVRVQEFWKLIFFLPLDRNHSPGNQGNEKDSAGMKELLKHTHGRAL